MRYPKHLTKAFSVCKPFFSTLLIFQIALLAGCGPSPEEIAAQIESHVRSTLVSIPTQTPAVLRETVVVTEIVERIVLVTATLTSTPFQTATLTPTSGPSPTPTEVPGIGDPFECGDYFTVTVIKEPWFRERMETETAAGQYLFVNFTLINNTSSTYQSLRSDDYKLEGKVGGNTITFTHDNTASWWWHIYFGHYEKEYDDDVAPGLLWESTVAFDVNPEGEDWVFIFEPGREDDCRVQIPLSK